MNHTFVMLLAGGRGTRLNILGAHRAKPAVPFGGMYRIIDFALSNCMHSRLQQVGVLTQYRPRSLNRHLDDGSHWDMGGKYGLLRNLPPFQAAGDFDWYHGTADAVLQNLDFVRRYRPARVLILSGDHIYRMDYLKMIEFHRDRRAALTVAAMPVPMEETHRFGILAHDDDLRVTQFQEKPEVALSNLASMGIYVFDFDVLETVLDEMSTSGGTDFGRDVIPGMLERFDSYVYPFEGYWRDVGTIDSYFDASMDLLDPASGIDLFQWRTRTNLAYEGASSMPAARVASGAAASQSLISRGCYVCGEVRRSILSPGVVVEAGAVVEDSIIMHRSVVEKGAHVKRSIVDKHCVIGQNARVGVSGAASPNRLTPDHLTSGLVVVGKFAHVPANATINGNVIIHPNVTGHDYPSLTVPEGETVTAR